VGSFTATPSTVPAGGFTELNWTTTNATNVTIDNGVGPQPVNGSVTVIPAGTTTYTLTATGPGGTATASVTVTVDAPSVISFTATPPTITAGGSTTLRWTTTNATSVVINNGVGSQPANGSADVLPTVTTVYTLTAIGPGGTSSSTVTVTVNPAAPLVNSFTATPDTIIAGNSVTLAWTTSGATGVLIDNGIGNKTASGSIVVSPVVTTTYELTATGPAGSVTRSVTVTVIPRTEIINFTASPIRIRNGESATLLFSTVSTTTVTIDNGIGNVPSSGSITVSPTSTTTYTLTAQGQGLTLTAQAIVEVIVEPLVLVSSFPAGLIQRADEGGDTNSYVLTNVGGSDTQITLLQVGTFFTQSPSSFVLAPGANQVITIVGNPVAAGAYEGTSLPSGNGVPAGLSIPVRLLSADPPAGTVLPIPSSNRLDLTSPDGSVDFRNEGTATLRGIIVSDVPWLVPPGGIITIPPGATITVFFTIDRSKRPDADALNGSVTGTLSLVYADGPGGSSAVGSIRPLANTPPPSTSKPVTVIDTATPVIKQTGPPPLKPGEVALVIPGIGRADGAVADLSITNSGAPVSLDGVNLFFSPSGTSASLAQSAVLALSPNLPVAFSDMSRTMFGSSATSGTLQIRSDDTSKISTHVSMVNSVSLRGTYSGSLAVFRSDRASGPNQAVTLAGVRNDSGNRSDLYLQEAAGLPALARTEFFDAQGRRLNSRVDEIGAFGVIELRGIVPAGAVSAVVTNTSQNNARIVAQAMILDQATGDLTNIVDWNARNGVRADAAQLLPLVVTTEQEVRPRTELTIVNSGTEVSTATVTLFVPGQGRRRSSRPAAGAGSVPIQSMATTTRQITLAPGEAQLVSDVVGIMDAGGKSSAGYVVFAPEAGSRFTVTGRSYAAAGASFGTGIPSTALTSGLRVGESRKIAGLEDASTASVRGAKPGTFRTSLGLIETSGQSVTVRVTMRFAAGVPGGLAEVRATSTKEYVLSPRQVMSFREIGREMFGPGRESVGDLHNLQMDIDVVRGQGAVIPYTVSTENGSGDTLMRLE